MKAIWRGNVSFALVSVPVRAYGATRSKSISFHVLHKKCSTPLEYERHCPTCDINVAWQDVAHGFEYEKGRFVTVTDKEMENLPLKSTKSIDILRFVMESDIDPLYYGRAYYLEPEEGGERAYALLREVMGASKKAALSKIAFKEKEHIALVRVHEGALTLHTLYYADEVIKPSALNIPGKISLDRSELNLASELLKHFEGKPELEAFHDEFREALMGLIKDKVAGKEIKVAPKREAAKVVSLMDALKESLKKGAVPPAQKGTVSPLKRGAIQKKAKRKAG